ncbi:MAG: hypothetical protein N7Q72_02250, partial [Spiroplasma sp. Tabriz.8]|nr:hypothetical protein [Spiroplasma sp. Tabriz.8]
LREWHITVIYYNIYKTCIILFPCLMIQLPNDDDDNHNHNNNNNNNNNNNVVKNKKKIKTYQNNYWYFL